MQVEYIKDKYIKLKIVLNDLEIFYLFCNIISLN